MRQRARAAGEVRAAGEGRGRRGRRSAGPVAGRRSTTSPGNRAAVRALAAGRRIQRMVVVAADDYTTSDDALVLNNADYAKSMYGGPIKDFKAHKDLSGLKERETLVVVEHGLPGEIGKKKAPEVAKILHDNGMPRKTARIVLYSCFAGAEEATSKQSLVTQLADELKRYKRYEHWPIPVWGQKGVGFAFGGIGERTTAGGFEQSAADWFVARWKLSKKPAHKPLYQGSLGKAADLASRVTKEPTHTILTKMKDTDKDSEYIDLKGANDVVRSANAVLKARSEPEIVPAPDPASMDFEAKASLISRLMKPFWRDAVGELSTALEDRKAGWQLQFKF